MSYNSQYVGQARPESTAGNYNQQRFLVLQEISKLSTCLPVEVIAVRGGVDNTGKPDIVGVVDIKPLVQQITGDGQTTEHGIITNVPYFRLQGGGNAIVIDPQIGDMGIACFSQRDITAVKNSRKSAPPGSRRLYDMSDALYIGGILNAAPTQYIQFTANGIIVHSPQKVTINAPAIEAGGEGDTLYTLLMHTFKDFFNNHTHTSSGAGVPSTALTDSYFTSKVKAD